jgi:hypothetical protein
MSYAWPTTAISSSWCGQTTTSASLRTRASPSTCPTGVAATSCATSPARAQRQPGDQPVVDHDRRPPGDGQRLELEPSLEHLGRATGPLERRPDDRFRHAVAVAQIGPPVGGGGAESQSMSVHALDVHSRQRGIELAGNLDRDRDAAARHADNHRLVELEGGEGFRESAPRGGAIPEERRDPRDDAHRQASGVREFDERRDGPPVPRGSRDAELLLEERVAEL